MSAAQKILDGMAADPNEWIPPHQVVELVAMFKDEWAHEAARRDVLLGEAVAARHRAEAVNDTGLPLLVRDLAMYVRRLAAQVPPCPQKTAAMGYLERHGLYALLRRGPAA